MSWLLVIDRSELTPERIESWSGLTLTSGVLKGQGVARLKDITLAGVLKGLEIVGSTDLFFRLILDGESYIYQDGNLVPAGVSWSDLSELYMAVPLLELHESFGLEAYFPNETSWLAGFRAYLESYLEPFLIMAESILKHLGVDLELNHRIKLEEETSSLALELTKSYEISEIKAVFNLTDDSLRKRSILAGWDGQTITLSEPVGAGKVIEVWFKPVVCTAYLPSVDFPELPFVPAITIDDIDITSTYSSEGIAWSESKARRVTIIQPVIRLTIGFIAGRNADLLRLMSAFSEKIVAQPKIASDEGIEMTASLIGTPAPSIAPSEIDLRSGSGIIEVRGLALAIKREQADAIKELKLRMGVRND